MVGFDLILRTWACELGLGILESKTKQMDIIIIMNWYACFNYEIDYLDFIFMVWIIHVNDFQMEWMEWMDGIMNWKGGCLLQLERAWPYYVFNSGTGGRRGEIPQN